MTHSPPQPPSDAEHEHVFLGDAHARNERRTWLVIGLTAAMMMAEIAAGTVYGSMALLADGWHMSTHAAALLIAALAYRFARRNARNPRFTFGTGKLGDLAGFASAVVLGVIALLIAWESLMRLRGPIAISFDQAILVAVIGLAVNLACAWLLRDDHAHHGHDHGHGNDHGHSHDHVHDHEGNPARAAGAPAARDNNLRAAYLHVLADALTSVMAIVALSAGRIYGWVWLDPVIGVVGAAIIASWSWGLIVRSGAVLLDYIPNDEHLPAEIRAALETGDDRITDLHVWRLGPGHNGAIVSLVARRPQAVAAYKRKLAHLTALSHLTVEVQSA